MQSCLLPHDMPLAADLDLKRSLPFSKLLCGPHSLHVHRPERFRLRYQGHLFKGMSTTVGYVEHGTDITVNVAAREIERTYNISVPVSGFQELRARNVSLVSTIDCGIIIGAEQPLQLDVPGDCRKILVTINRDSLELVLQEILGKDIGELIVFNESISAIDGATAAWWRMIKTFLSELQYANELYGSAFFNRDIEAALLKGLLIVQPNNYSDRIRKALATKVPEYVTRAKVYIENNFRQEIHLPDLEVVAGVALPTLISNFRAYIGFTPIAYLKHVRLRQVRAYLLSNRPMKNISSIAFGCGFNHLGRFSADYKREFLETPRETIKRKLKDYSLDGIGKGVKHV